MKNYQHAKELQEIKLYWCYAKFLELMETGLCSSGWCCDVNLMSGSKLKQKLIYWKRGFPRERQFGEQVQNAPYFISRRLYLSLFWSYVEICEKVNWRTWKEPWWLFSPHLSRDLFCSPGTVFIKGTKTKHRDRVYSWSFRQLGKLYAQSKQGHNFLWRTI